MILPSFICFVQNIELNGIISSCNGFYIPVKETQFLAVVNIINIENTEEEDEKNDGQT